MALTFDPFREMDRMTARLLGGGGAAAASSWMPMDLYRAGDHYVVHVDLPGIDPGSIDLGIDAGTLTIQAERTIGGGDQRQWIAQERPAGRYMRQLSLGTDVDLDRIEASYEHGVLTLTIPVAERAKPRKIEVQHGGGGQSQIGTGQGSSESESSTATAGSTS
ncbi:Hsp20/alpha crystallin family protein [Agrococcus sp. TF02-05]|uniref:Hsp20/alpha crystallin family protein n=1 Tax=Agrococcus sp. TF02-05 TaxID=2815211 RepID=UPI001AA1C619|nr:Hsp20/alpha crystallin family protein [Agrococcus sp. TF02-05]MBO1771109.1 Hsp20/alpha crystallin family protein [Agrococcus sp. TF02-05]